MGLPLDEAAAEGDDGGEGHTVFVITVMVQCAVLVVAALRAEARG